jgi:predicted lipase
MKITNELLHYVAKMYGEIRYADRGLFFKKSNKERIDLSTINGVKSYFSVKNTQAAIVEKDGWTIVFCIGSNQISDWILNFLFLKKKIPYKSSGTSKKIKTHSGFLKTYLNMREWTHEQVKDKKNVLVFGQSLGAAVATLAALDIKYNFSEVNLDVILCGSPRVGNAAFKESFNKRIDSTKRFVYGNDIVPALPPKMLGFEHVCSSEVVGKERKCLLTSKDHMWLKTYQPTLIKY